MNSFYLQAILYIHCTIPKSIAPIIYRQLTLWCLNLRRQNPKTHCVRFLSWKSKETAFLFKRCLFSVFTLKMRVVIDACDRSLDQKMLLFKKENETARKRCLFASANLYKRTDKRLNRKVLCNQTHHRKRSFKALINRCFTSMLVP